MLADIYWVDITDDDVARLREQMRTMPAHPDAVEGLTTLRDNGFRLATLTNSPHLAGTSTPLENAGLAGLFERQISVESVRAFKPSPSVYRHACQELGVEPADCMMVAAHVWDTLGAQSVGMHGALITRPGNPPLPIDGLPQPDLVVGDLRELAHCRSMLSWSPRQVGVRTPSPAGAPPGTLWPGGHEASPAATDLANRVTNRQDRWWSSVDSSPKERAWLPRTGFTLISTRPTSQ